MAWFAACLPTASWIQPGFGSHQGLHLGTSQDMTKFTEIRSSIKIHRNPQFTCIIWQNSASSSHKEEMHLTRRNATISQKFVDKKECKNSWTSRNTKTFLVTIHNLSPHSNMSIKFSSGCDHLFHEEFGNSFTNICQKWFVERMLN
jgi:hypothetical protein